jgi:hypothetical protein
MKYRKKPVEVEAWPVSDLLLARWTHKGKVPDPIWDEMLAGRLAFYAEYITVKTLEGYMRARPGDMMIRGVMGEMYPCRKDIFAASYERVEA